MVRKEQDLACMRARFVCRVGFVRIICCALLEDAAENLPHYERLKARNDIQLNYQDRCGSSCYHR
jgi:hypothetical protein